MNFASQKRKNVRPQLFSGKNREPPHNDLDNGGVARAKLNSTQYSTALNSTQQHSVLNSTQQHSTALNSTQQYSTTLNSTQQHSTALGSTQHTTALNSTQQHSTALNSTQHQQHSTALNSIHFAVLHLKVERPYQIIVDIWLWHGQPEKNCGGSSSVARQRRQTAKGFSRSSMRRSGSCRTGRCTSS